MRLELIPHVGAGPVRLGMTRDQARDAVGVEPQPFLKSPGSPYPTDAFDGLGIGFHVYYDGPEPVVDFIELANGGGLEALLGDVDVFATPADVLVARLEREHALDPSSEPGYLYLFRDLGLSLWRSTIPESEDDPEGRYFDAVAIGTPESFS
jgi:hypothetical protein